MQDIILDESILTDQYKKEVVRDFELCCISREASVLARKEVLTGKAKFGITGDGKEVAQVVLAKFFQKGDFRAGYYRDQTLMFALGICTVEQFFAQLYADNNNDPFSGGRQMNNHFATPLIDDTGEWTDHTSSYNISADVSCTAGQMARALGLALASQKYRAMPKLSKNSLFSNHGNEVTFCTIGDASTSEGVFWETLNTAAVKQLPLAVSVWDDGYGISVPTKFQTVKESISKALEGFRLDETATGIDIYVVKGGDYKELCTVYNNSISKTRKKHTPCLIHVTEMTQPQGHSTSGSHERYKSTERLEWERKHDCITKMGEWMVKNELASDKEILEIKKRAKNFVKESKDKAWKAYMSPIKTEMAAINEIYTDLAEVVDNKTVVVELHHALNRLMSPINSEIVKNARQMLFAIINENDAVKKPLKEWLHIQMQLAHNHFHTHLYSHSPNSALNVPAVPPEYSQNSPVKNGYEILNNFFDKAFQKHPNLLAFGEDVGQIGDVNQGFAGMQTKYSKERVFDTGIREWSIMGQGLGLAMRGFRPIAEIQYLDYLIYGIEPLSDDLATLRYRSNNQQMAPAIIRTRGHRLEGIWHAGSPLGMIINALRGMYVCVPRNMTQATGMYNTLLQSDDPALVIESLNGYRLKERLADNIGEYTVPLGIPEVLQEGEDVTVVTYGSCVRIVQAGIVLLEKHGISVELIDVQTLLPFDIENRIGQSLEKTNRILFVDEDVPGGATAYMLQEIIEKQSGYQYLDSPPVTLTAKAHRPPYGSDGDYFSKPNPEDVFEAVFKIMQEATPNKWTNSL